MEEVLALVKMVTMVEVLLVEVLVANRLLVAGMEVLGMVDHKRVNLHSFLVEAEEVGLAEVLLLERVEALGMS